MEQTFTIRQAEIKDRLILIEMYFKLIESVDVYEQGILPTYENAEIMVDNVILPAVVDKEGIFLAYKNDQAVGAIFWAMARLPYTTHFKYAYGYGSYVDPHFQKLGIASTLRKKATEALLKLGIKKIINMVHFENKASLKYSEKIKYKAHARLDVIDLEDLI